MPRARNINIVPKVILTVTMAILLITYLSRSFDIVVSPVESRSASEIQQPQPAAFAPETKTDQERNLRQTLLDAGKGLPLDIATIRNTSRLVFNRVGKCGSRSLVHTIDLLSKKHKFPHVKSKIFDKKRLQEHEQAEFAFEVDSYDPPFIYNRHLNFVDFDRFGVETPYWINLIRDPLNRTISFFYYSRFGDGVLTRSDASGRDINLTFDDCVLENRPECNITNIFAIIPYFCGQNPGCDVPTRYALETAKQNVIDHFIFVGALEEFNSTLYILEQLLPHFFEGAPEAYQATLEKGLVESYKSVQRKEPSDQVKKIMRERLSIEYEFYFFIRRRMELIRQQLISEGLLTK